MSLLDTVERNSSESIDAARPAFNLDVAPALAAICYPFFLDVFHFIVGPPETRSSSSTIMAAATILACILAVPALGLAFATRKTATTGARRLAYACVVAPTAYVFLGVVQTTAGSPIPDQLVWCLLWCAAAYWAWCRPCAVVEERSASTVGRWRVVHGITGAVVMLYVSFHVFNHLFSLIGPEAHTRVMDMGRKIYRAPLVEPLLITLMLFQIASGLYLAWQWSKWTLNFQKTLQVASGFYLSVFIFGHMNSVFVYARTYLGIPTNWAFATGAPNGLIPDAWNIRLLPHYLLGVFFLLAHLGSGLRMVLIAHGVHQRRAHRIWITCILSSLAISVAVIVGICGGRIARI